MRAAGDLRARRLSLDAGRLSRLRPALLRVLVAANLLLGALYLSWRWGHSINRSFLWYAVPLVVAETYSYVDAWLFGLTIWKLRDRRQAPAPPVDATVDVFVTCYREPVELVRGTVRAAKAIRHPHQTYVLDDGDSPTMRAMCREEGAGYITRGAEWEDRPRHAKAGNLSNALMQTSGELILMLDADQLAEPDVLDEVLGYFADPKLAFVQTPQLFYNVPGGDPFGSQAPLFYGPIQQGKDGWNAAFFCGSNAVLRREALLQLGVEGYAKALAGGLRRALKTAGRVAARAARKARRSGDVRSAAALERLRQAVAASEAARRGGASVQEVTYAFQRRVDEISRTLVAEDLALIRAELAELTGAAETAPEEAGPEAPADGRMVAALAGRELSPLGAVEAVRRLVRAIDVDRAEEAQPILPMSTISITEDMATAMRLHAAGWRSAYHQRILVQGLAPEDLRSALAQRLRWAQGTIQVLLRENPLLLPGLSAGQRLMYLSTMWGYLSGFFAVVYLAGPALYLIFGVSPVRSYSAPFFWHLVPYLAVNQLLFVIVGWGRSTWRGQQYSLALFPLWIEAVIGACANVFFDRKLAFVSTPKTRQGYNLGLNLRLVKWQLGAMALLAVGVAVGFARLASGQAPDAGPVLVNIGWAVYQLVLLSVVLEAAAFDPRRHDGAIEPARV